MNVEVRLSLDCDPDASAGGGPVQRASLLSAPAAGRSVLTSTEERAVHVRAAVDAVRAGFVGNPLADYHALFDCAWKQPPGATGGADSELAGWAVVSMALLARLAGASATDLDGAERWFFGRRFASLPSLASHVRPDASRAA